MTKFVIKEPVKGYSAVNEDTGEIMLLEASRVLTRDGFMMVFLEGIPDIVKLSRSEIKILMCLWKESIFNNDKENNGNIFYNTPLMKEKIRNYVGRNELNDKTIDTAISSLCKKEFVVRLSKGVYMMNPQYFFKGTLKDSIKVTETFKAVLLLNKN